MTQSPNRTQSRLNFFKYMSVATASSVLTNHSLRWSSPVLFNDPFDVPREMSFGITPAEIIDAGARRIMALLEYPPEETSHLELKLRLIVETVKKGISDELKAQLLAGLKETSASHKPTEASMDALRELWRSWIPELRILCLTDSPAHAAMWYHYADQYKGAVLEFRCVDELSSAWLAAKPVTYPEAKPAVYTADGWAELLSMQQELAIQKMLDLSTYTKAPDWSYENEWRITSFKRPTDTGLFTDYTFSPLELAGVYLGPLMDNTDKNNLTALARNYPSTKVVAVSIGMSREFLFNELA